MVTTLKSPLDLRNDRSKTVGCSKLLTFEIAAGTTITLALSNLAGQLVGIEYIAPNLTTDATFALDFLSKNDVSLGSKATLADTKVNGFYVNTVTDNIHLPTNCKAKVTIVTSQTATIEVILHLK